MRRQGRLLSTTYRGPFLACPVHATKAVGSKRAAEDSVINTLFHLLAIWTAVSFSIGLTWVALCYTCEGIGYVRRSRWGWEPAPSQFSSRSWSWVLPCSQFELTGSRTPKEYQPLRIKGAEGESAGISPVRLTSSRAIGSLGPRFCGLIQQSSHIGGLPDWPRIRLLRAEPQVIL